MYEPRDEISLRELYLIFRSGLLAIVLAALVAGAAAYLYLGSRPDRYVAGATVQVNVPAPSTTSEEAAWLLPPAGIGFSSYAAIAHRSDVLAAAFGVNQSDVARLRELAGSLELNPIDTSQQARGQLAVAHLVTAPDPQEAAQRANAWAQATVEATTAALSQSVNANAEASARELAQREAELNAVRQQLTEFAEQDDRNAVGAQIAVHLQLQRDAMMRLAELDNLIASSRAQRDLLQSALEARSGTGSGSLEAQLRAMVGSGALDEGTAAQLERALAQLPPGATTGGQDLLTLVTRTQVETLTSQLAGYLAEREQLRVTLNGSNGEYAALRTQLTEMNQRFEQLELARRTALRAYESVSALTPLIRLQQGMIGTAAKVVVPATPPIQPEARSRLTLTLAAALVAGLLATLVVFLRAAVRAPDPDLGPGPHGRELEIDQVSGNPRRTSDRIDGRLADER